MAAVCAAGLEPKLKHVFICGSGKPVHHGGMKRCVAPLLCALTMGLALAPAHADSDQDRARAAVQAGQVLPLKTLLDRLERDVPGQVLEVELEQDGERWTYEVRLLQAGGRLVKLDIDATTGEVLQRRDRGRDGGHRH